MKWNTDTEYNLCVTPRGSKISEEIQDIYSDKRKREGTLWGQFSKYLLEKNHLERRGSTFCCSNPELQLTEVDHFPVFYSFNGILTLLPRRKPFNEQKTTSKDSLEDLKFKSTNNKSYGTVTLKELYKWLGLSHRTFGDDFLSWRENRCIILEAHTTLFMLYQRKRLAAPKILRRNGNSELEFLKKAKSRLIFF